MKPLYGIWAKPNTLKNLLVSLLCRCDRQRLSASNEIILLLPFPVQMRWLPSVRNSHMAQRSAKFSGASWVLFSGYNNLNISGLPLMGQMVLRQKWIFHCQSLVRIWQLYIMKSVEISLIFLVCMLLCVCILQYPEGAFLRLSPFSSPDEPGRSKRRLKLDLFHA